MGFLANKMCLGNEAKAEGEGRPWCGPWERTEDVGTGQGVLCVPGGTFMSYTYCVRRVPSRCW